MALPKVSIIQKSGGLGRLPANTDGVAALVISVARAPVGTGALALNTTATVFALEDAEALGITATYDAETEAGVDEQRVWARVRDFYREAGAGAKLYLRLVSGSVTQAAMLGAAGAVYEVLRVAQGDVKLVAVALSAGGGTVVNGLDGDVYTAVAAAKALVATEQAQYRYCQVLVEGRSFSGTIGNLTNLRASGGPTANRVSVVLGADMNERTVEAASPTASIGSAAVGLVLGRLARIQVHRNIGRVLDGAVAGVVSGGLSGGQVLATYTDAQLGTLNDLGFLFLRQHPGKTGYYWNQDYTAAPTEDDFSSIARGRVMDKASRIVRRVYTDNLLDNVDVDPNTGQLATAVVKGYQATAETAIEREMVAADELSGVFVTVDPDQDVLSTDLLETLVELVPKGLVGNIRATLAYKNPQLAA